MRSVGVVVRFLGSGEGGVRLDTPHSEAVWPGASRLLLGVDAGEGTAQGGASHVQVVLSPPPLLLT